MNGKYEHLTNVEADIIWFLVQREIEGKKGWYRYGRKELANEIQRHEKSIVKAMEKMQVKGKITTKKMANKIWIKQTLSTNELNSRIAFIDPIFCCTESEQELEEILEKEIHHLEKEIKLAKETNQENQELDREIDNILKRITERDITELEKKFTERTYENSNDTAEVIVTKALQNFREEIFAKYGERGGEQETYNIFWSEQ